MYGQWLRAGRCLGLRDEELPPDLQAFTAYFTTTLTTLERTEPVRHLLGPAHRAYAGMARCLAHALDALPRQARALPRLRLPQAPAS